MFNPALNLETIIHNSLNLTSHYFSFTPFDTTCMYSKVIQLNVVQMIQANIEVQFEGRLHRTHCFMGYKASNTVNYSINCFKNHSLGGGFTQKTVVVNFHSYYFISRSWQRYTKTDTKIYFKVCIIIVLANTYNFHAYKISAKLA